MRAAWRRSLTFWAGLVGDALHRFVSLAFALVALLLLAPLLLVRGVAGRIRTGRVFERETRIGRFRQPFEQLGFAGNAPAKSFALLLNVLRGDMALAGPRALRPEEAAAIPPGFVVRFDVRPGLVSPYSMRSRTGIAHECEEDVDSEFVYGQSVGGDMGLVARSIPSLLIGGSSEREAPPEFEIFGIDIVNTTMDEAVEWVLRRCHAGDPAQLCFVNPDCLNIAYVDEDYKDVLHRAARVLPDGIGVHLACRMMGTSLVANVNGTDLFPKLCEAAAESGESLFLLGAKPGRAEETARRMAERFPGVRFAGARDGYFSTDEEEAVIEEINRSGADILLVAMGAPRQERWIARHADRLAPRVRMGVGGLFDYYSGQVKRAPIWVREIGMEWLWRTMQEPGRLWRRYFIGNPVFLWRVRRAMRG